MITNASRFRPCASAFLHYFAPVLIASVLCAALTTYLIHIGNGIAANLTMAACIGITATLLGIGGRFLLWVEKPHKLGFPLMLALLAPPAFIIGKLLANRLLGRPQEIFTLNQPDTVTGVIVLSLMAGVGGILHYRKREKAAACDAHEALLEKQSAQVRLQMLQAQIQPHLLFDTLEKLQTLVSSEPLRAQQMVDQLVHYLRATLSASRDEQTTLGQELELLRAYLGLMSLRMGLRLTYSLQLPDELHRIRIVPMLLQPLVENAIRHGLEPKTGGGDCTVRVTRHHDMLVISVFDTGKGLQALTSYNRPDSNHSGLENIRARLETRYGALAELTLTHNIPEGTVAQITIPIEMLKGRT